VMEVTRATLTAHVLQVRASQARRRDGPGGLPEKN
jgi:hypothetical protein